MNQSPDELPLGMIFAPHFPVSPLTSIISNPRPELNTHADSETHNRKTIKASNRQPGITPYRAHAHKRYSSMYRVPEHVFLTFSHYTELNLNQRILNMVKVRVRVRV